jgi:hypothetical protein
MGLIGIGGQEACRHGVGVTEKGKGSGSAFSLFRHAVVILGQFSIGCGRSKEVSW